MNENTMFQADALNEVTSPHLNVSVDFSLLGADLAGAVEKNEKGVEFLVMPQQNCVAEKYLFNDMVDGINDFFKEISRSENFRLDPQEIFKKLKEIAGDLIMEALKVSIKQVFVHFIKPKDAKMQMEYAFSIGINLTKDMLSPGSAYAGVQSLTFGIWNTDNKKILSKMGLLNISEQLANIDDIQPARITDNERKNA